MAKKKAAKKVAKKAETPVKVPRETSEADRKAAIQRNMAATGNEVTARKQKDKYCHL